MDKVVKLKDGTDVIIRPLRKDDLGRSLAFFRALPIEDRLYLRKNVTRLEVVKQRILDIESDEVRRLVIVCGDEIVADGALELKGHDWKEHTGELRVIVARPFQRKGLGMLLTRELYLLAVSERLEKLVIKVMEPQIAARKIVEKLGFREDTILTQYARDIKGERHNLVVMQCDLNSVYQALEDYFTDMDWERRK
jgi:RimJ/RimL family protein N-acetyltransferase